MSNLSRLFLAAVCGGALSAGVLCAADTGAAAIDEKAGQTLRAMADHYKSLSGATVQTTMRVKQIFEGQTMNSDVTVDFSAARPNRFAMVPAGSQKRGATVISDGKQLMVLNHDANRYTLQDSPASLDEVFHSEAVEAFAMNSFPGVYVGRLFAADPYAALTKSLVSARHLGDEKIGEQNHHRLRLEENDFVWEIWVTEGPKPQLTRVVPDLSRQLAEARAAGQKIDVQLSVDLAWNTQDAPADDRFAILEPKEAEKVNSFFEQEKHPVQDKSAADFELPDLDGNKVKLSSHQGKEVVILDFWATWCGPCVRAMPVLAEVAEAYKAKGVVLYAVNVDPDDDNDKVRAFLKQHKLSVKVLQDDARSSVSQSYKVEGIPQTVVIDKKGVVKIVHVGFLPDLKERLGKELDQLLAQP